MGVIWWAVYDLTNEPLEKVNLIDDASVADVRSELIDRLDEWRRVHARPEDHPWPLER